MDIESVLFGAEEVLCINWIEADGFAAPYLNSPNFGSAEISCNALPIRHLHLAVLKFYLPKVSTP